MVEEVGVIGMDGLDGVNVGGWMKGGAGKVDACAAEDGGWGVRGCRWWRGDQDWVCGWLRVSRGGELGLVGWGVERWRASVPFRDVKSPHGLHHSVPGMDNFRLPARVRCMPERLVTLLSRFPFSLGTEPGAHILFAQLGPGWSLRLHLPPA